MDAKDILVGLCCEVAATNRTLLDIFAVVAGLVVARQAKKIDQLDDEVRELKRSKLD